MFVSNHSCCVKSITESKLGYLLKQHKLIFPHYLKSCSFKLFHLSCLFNNRTQKAVMQFEVSNKFLINSSRNFQIYVCCYGQYRGRHGNSLQFSCLENPWGHKESDTTKVTQQTWTIYFMSDSFLIRFLLFTSVCKILVENLSLFFCSSFLISN